MHDRNVGGSEVGAGEKPYGCLLYTSDYNNIIPTRPYTEDLMGLPVINIRHVPLTNTCNAFMKRSMDLVGSVFAIILFSPVMLVTAIAIKLTSPGPLIYTCLLYTSSADIWQQIGASQEEFPEAYFGTRMTYVEVFFNHEYWGLYVLMEPVDSKQLDRTKEGEPAQEEYSYKSVTPQSESTEELLNQEEYGETLSGYELKGSHTTIDRSSWEALLSYLELRDLADDQEFAEKASELTDREGALDVWIYLQAVLGIDNRGKNMSYVAKNRGNTQKIYFAPWDMDITWGDALSAGTGGNVWDVGLNTALYSERINWSFGDRLIELDAVSYTHLDVYKRQTTSSWISPGRMKRSRWNICINRRIRRCLS